MIYLIRHGESKANIGSQDPISDGDAYIELSDTGTQQALDAGAEFGAQKLSNCRIYSSPYLRARETASLFIKGAGMDPDKTRVYEDPRLREVERGYLSEAQQHPMRIRHGWFYYRHSGGESPADCYDRTSAFLESLMRVYTKQPDKDVLIVCHGMTIRCFVMRFLHLSVEQFVQMKNPDNGDLITIAPAGSLKSSIFQSANWEVSGLNLRDSCDDS